MSVQDDVLRAWREAVQKGQVGEYEQLEIGGPEKLVVLPHDALAKLQRELDEVKLQRSIDWFQAQGLMDDLESPETESKTSEDLATDVAAMHVGAHDIERLLLHARLDSLVHTRPAILHAILGSQEAAKASWEVALAKKKIFSPLVFAVGGNKPVANVVTKTLRNKPSALRAHTQKAQRRKVRAED